MFDHSIKVPRLYKSAAKIAKAVSDGKGSIKQLVYEGKHPNVKALYALVVHTFQNTQDIERLLKKSKLLFKEPRFDPWLAKILITELLWGKKRLSSLSKPIQTILAYEQIFKAHLSDVDQEKTDVNQVEKPRYVRINTLKITVNEAVENFRNEGWVLKRYTDSSNYLGFLEALTNLGNEEFMVDFHIPYLLIFPPKTQFYQHEAYKNGNIILQDKASCLPVHMLNPDQNSVVLDMCAAPGMKTTHCAAILQNQGKIYAVEIGKKRFQTLQKIVDSAGASCVECINADVLTLKPYEYSDIEFILVDPSCSGSGITDRIEIGQQDLKDSKTRLEKLAAFQITMLRRALTKFRNVKRVVYSTCSIYPEENEDVVRQVLETCLYFKLIPAGQFIDNNWLNYGSPDFGDIGSYCLYAKPDMDLTSGFFVAVFERLQDGETNQFLNRHLYAQRTQKKKHKKEHYKEEEEEETKNEEIKSFNELELSEPTDIHHKKKIKKEKKTEMTDVVQSNDTSDSKPEIQCENSSDHDKEVRHKKKKKIKQEKIDIGCRYEDVECDISRHKQANDRKMSIGKKGNLQIAPELMDRIPENVKIENIFENTMEGDTKLQRKKKHGISEETFGIGVKKESLDEVEVLNDENCEFNISRRKKKLRQTVIEEINQTVSVKKKKTKKFQIQSELVDNILESDPKSEVEIIFENDTKAEKKAKRSKKKKKQTSDADIKDEKTGEDEKSYTSVEKKKKKKRKVLELN